MIKTYIQNPDVDLLFGLVGEIVPTKKEDFKPIPATTLDEKGNEVIFDSLYVKKPDKQSVINFEAKIRETLSDSYYTERIIKQPKSVEVFISVSINKKRFYEVDVDNLAKTVLDSMVGLIIDDDAQVVNLICTKYIHPDGINGVLIGVTELTAIRKGFISHIKLFGKIH